MIFDNYRKASKGEVCCWDCDMSFYHPLTKRLRCGSETLGMSQVVGKFMTCDDSQRRKIKEASDDGSTTRINY